ncbi:hypothetical protein PCE1_001092 [Barthelona sp. PCE]
MFSYLNPAQTEETMLCSSRSSNFDLWSMPSINDICYSPDDFEMNVLKSKNFFIEPPAPNQFCTSFSLNGRIVHSGCSDGNYKYQADYPLYMHHDPDPNVSISLYPNDFLESNTSTDTLSDLLNGSSTAFKKSNESKVIKPRKRRNVKRSSKITIQKEQLEELVANGFTQSQMAQVLNCSTNTIKRRLASFWPDKRVRSAMRRTARRRLRKIKNAPI